MLSLNGIDSHPDQNGHFITLIFSNNSDRPIEFEMDWPKTYMIIDRKRLHNDIKQNSGAIITKSNTYAWVLPYNFEEIIEARKKIPHYELIYGNPGNFLYRQIHELNIRVSPLYDKLSITYNEEKREEIPIKRQVTRK